MSSLPVDATGQNRRKRSNRQVLAIDPPEYTIQEAAARLGIAEQKLRRWDAQGVLVARRTEGGHRRYAREIVDGLAGSAGLPAARTESQNDELARARQDIKEKRRIIQLLIESESRYRDLVETSHDLIWTTDAVGRFTYVNSGSVDIFGLEPAALIGRCFFDFESEPSHISNRRFLSTLRRDGEVRDHLTHLIAADGTDRWVGINARVWYDNGRIIGLRGTARNVTELHRAALQIEHLASHDPLTGLPNEASLARTLDEAIANDEKGAVLRIDIDQLKSVAERHGATAADELIVAVSGILRDLTHDRDAGVFRYRGGQFAVLLPHASVSTMEALASDALVAVRHFTPVLPTSAEIMRLTASAGIAAYPADGDQTSVLLDNAERAIDDAKVRGGDCCVTFHPQPRDIQKQDVRAKWKHDLRQALDEDRLVLYSQSVVSLTSSRAPLEEVFVRFVQDDGAVIEPSNFIGIAESVGLVQEIDLRVVGKMLAYIGEMSAPPATTKYFVNLSRASVFDPYWLPRFYALLEKSGADRSRLVFEISESDAMSNVEMAKSMFSRLKEMGCGCALDHFGTGFSSLYYLKQFDVDFLKVDGAFVRDLVRDKADRLFMRALYDVAKGLDRDVIAEWVETPEVLSELKSLGIEYAQGHYIGRPAPFTTPAGAEPGITIDGTSGARPALPAAGKDAIEP